MARIRPTNRYQVTMPDGRIREMLGKRLLELPHWSECQVTTDLPYITFRIRRFKFGSSGGDPMREIKKISANVERERRDLEVMQKSLAAEEARLVGMKSNIVPLLKRSHKFSYERLKEAMLSDPAILDVKMPGEAWMKAKLLGRGYNEYDGTTNRMLVTFVPAIIRSQTGEVPLPPTQVVFRENGEVKGGNLCIHPHLQTAGMCGGNIKGLLAGMAGGDGDIFSAIDLMRIFTMSYHWESPLNNRWIGQSWDWWASMMSVGWPNEEPFDKPWMSLGFPLRDNITGEFRALSDVLGTDDHDEMLTAVHIGKQVWYYDKAKHGVDLTPNVFVTRGSRVAVGSAAYCTCGRPEPVAGEIAELPTSAEAPVTRLSCACHTSIMVNAGQSDGTPYVPVSTQPCTQCLQPYNRCWCPWGIASDWTRIEVGRGTSTYRCEFRGPNAGNFACLNATNARPGYNYVASVMYNLPRCSIMFQTGGYYNGPHWLCEAHLASVLSGDSSASPAALRTFTAENYVAIDEEESEVTELVLAGAEELEPHRLWCSHCEGWIDMRPHPDQGMYTCPDCGTVGEDMAPDEGDAEEHSDGNDEAHLEWRCCVDCGFETSARQDDNTGRIYCFTCGTTYPTDVTNTEEVAEERGAAQSLQEVVSTAGSAPARTLAFGGTNGITEHSPEPEGEAVDVVRGTDQTDTRDAGVRETPATA
jgi:uncharacterized Zn finger protein (UPF0148 family)